MNSQQLAIAANTVVQLDSFLEELMREATALRQPADVQSHGYITPSGELLLRQLQLSYWTARNALLEVIEELRTHAPRLSHASPHQFLVGLAAAALLVDAARFLRETFHRFSVIRRKLDEPDPVYGIPPRMYDDTQRSLVNAQNAWHLWQATRYYDSHRLQLHEVAVVEGLSPLIAIIERLRHRLRPSIWTFLRTRLRVRGRRAMRRVGRDLLGRANYAIQQAVSERLSELSVRPRHQPGVPREIRFQLISLLRPGDVLVVRKEFAATNYFLPGYWPHAALVVGAQSDLHRLGIADHEHVRSRLPLLQPIVTGDDDSSAQFVLEAMKDGVRVRSINSPLASDSIIALRPTLEPGQIAQALVNAFIHEGKPYDFNFDFTCSHRMVCTEVVYRAYEGVGGVQFQLQRHVGRYALAAGDLLRMALAGRHFEIVAAYSPAHGSTLATGAIAAEIIRREEGAALG